MACLKYLCLFCIKELGPDMIQKLRGYSEHLIRLVRHEECELTVHTVHYTRVRHLSTALSMTAAELCDSSSCDSSSSDSCSDSCPPHTDSIQQVLSTVTTHIPGMYVIMSPCTIPLLGIPATLPLPKKPSNRPCKVNKKRLFVI